MNELGGYKSRLSKKEFIERALLEHGDIYDYSKLKWVDQHTEICTACAWSNGELYTCSDDMQIFKWSQDGEMLGT